MSHLTCILEQVNNEVTNADDSDIDDDVEPNEDDEEDVSESLGDDQPFTSWRKNARFGGFDAKSKFDEEFEKRHTRSSSSS